MNKKEIKYHLINSALAGGLVLAGALAGGELTAQGLIAAFGASLVVFLTKFKEAWHKHLPKKATLGLFCFI